MARIDLHIYALSRKRLLVPWKDELPGLFSEEAGEGQRKDWGALRVSCWVYIQSTSFCWKYQSPSPSLGHLPIPGPSSINFILPEFSTKIYCTQRLAQFETCFVGIYSHNVFILPN